MMNLSEECIDKLKTWVGPSTWHTDHSLDMSRFFHFVKAYHSENGPHISDESILAETIASYANISTDSPLFQKIKEHVSLMYIILDYLKVTGGD